MKKTVWLVAILAAVILAGIIGVNSAFAQEPTIPPPGGTWNMVDYCHGAGGMMGGYGTGVTDQVTLKRVAGVLGLTYEQLTARLTQGETIAQVAQAQKVDTALVVTTILAPQSEILQVRVKYGYLTASQAQAITDQARLWIGQTIATPQYGYGIPTNPTTGYAPGFRGGGMMGGGTMGGMMGGGVMGGGMTGGGGMMGNR